MTHRSAARRPIPASLVLLLLPFVLGSAAVAAPQDGLESPARALSRRLSSVPRLAGTVGSRHAAFLVRDVLERAGFEVELDERVVLLSLPRRIELECTVGEERLVRRIERFDPDRVPAGDVPKFSAWSASGSVEAPVVDVGRGLRADYEALRARGVEVAGRVAVARYGGAYRGVKAELAESNGCAALLLFSDPAEDGAGRGAVWPRGPWKPGWAAQRGSIAPLARAPGDPSTPGWASPAPGASSRRLDARKLRASLPRIPCLPIGAADAAAILAAQETARVRLELDVPRELRTIVNVIGRLPGRTKDFVVAGNHRDAWVRGAQDAGSGTVSLLLAARQLGQRVAEGWRPSAGIVLGFWDAEESGLIGSTEWAEAHADELRAHAVAYVNADAVIGGLRFGVGGTPGLLSSLRAALERVPAPRLADDETPGNLWQQWTAQKTDAPSLGLPGSGSDYTVFLHHLGIPILDVGFGGVGSGQYHTAFDDFALMDRFIDPTWEGHETAGRTLAEILAQLAESGHHAFDHDEAATAMADMVRRTSEEDWLASPAAERLARAFDALASTVRASADPAPEGAHFYRSLAAQKGLAGRPWYRNRLWAPGLETGYAAETLPTLRSAARAGEAELERELQALIDSVNALAERWRVPATAPVEGTR